MLNDFHLSVKVIIDNGRQNLQVILKGKSYVH